MQHAGDPNLSVAPVDQQILGARNNSCQQKLKPGYHRRPAPLLLGIAHRKPRAAPPLVCFQHHQLEPPIHGHPSRCYLSWRRGKAAEKGDDKSGAAAKGKAKGKAEGDEKAGKVKGAQSINVRHILVGLPGHAHGDHRVR